MALCVNRPDTAVGVPAPQAYCRVVAYSYDVDADVVQIVVNVYFNASARAQNKNPIASTVYAAANADVFQGGGNKPNEQKCYDYLKTLNDFSGSTDV